MERDLLLVVVFIKPRELFDEETANFDNVLRNGRIVLLKEGP